MNAGEGFSNFTLALSDAKKATIVASLCSALLQAGHKISAGDKMNVLAFFSLQREGTYVARELKNLTAGKVLTLRDDNGVSLSGRWGCGRAGAGYCADPGRF